jgi:hypothetical protein
LYAERRRGQLRWELFIRRPLAEIADGILMPEGKVVAGLWDRQRGAYVALSRPFRVVPGAVVAAPLKVPASGTDLIAEVRWRTADQPYEDSTATFWIQTQEVRIEPDLVVAVGFRSYAFWYALRVERGELRADAPGSFVRLAVEPRPKTIERITATMGAKAWLDADVRLPPGLQQGAPLVHLRELPSTVLVGSYKVTPVVQRHRFEGLLPGSFEIALETALGKFAETVELSEGERGYVLLEPQLITVSGKVSHGEKGHPATLTFVTADRGRIDALADEEGAYEVDLLHPALSVSIVLDGVQGEPFVEYFNPFIDTSGERDFEVPETRFRVRVVDQKTRRGLRKASVSVRNTYLQKESGLGAALGERAVLQVATTDEEGWAVLPPLRPGSVEVWASADGYLPTPDPVQATIGVEEKGERSLVIPLDPAGDEVKVHLLLAQGAAAANADVLVADVTRGSMLFSASGDAEGFLRIPRRYTGVLLVKHPAAGCFVREWTPGEEASIEVRLPLPAAQQLQVRVIDARGAAVPGAMLALWIQGQKLSGGVLGFLTGGPPRANQGGYWTAKGLPAGPVAVLAWSSHPQAQAPGMGGLLDSQAVAVTSPWPPLVEIRLAE